MLVGERIDAAAIYATPRRKHLLSLVLAHVDFGQFHRHEVAQAALIMKRAVAHQVLNRRCLLSEIPLPTLIPELTSAMRGRVRTGSFQNRAAIAAIQTEAAAFWQLCVCPVRQCADPSG